ncbi:MAG: permease [Phycisphaerae bacterium]
MYFLTQWMVNCWGMLAESAPWLLVGCLLAGVIQVLVPVSRISRHLGRPGLAEVIKASAIGIPLPLCSCSVIPGSIVSSKAASRVRRADHEADVIVIDRPARAKSLRLGDGR